MRRKAKLELSKEVKFQMEEQIREYFYNERGEDLSNLGASLILDFIIEKLADEFYNQGIADAHRYFIDRTDELLGLQR